MDKLLLRGRRSSTLKTSIIPVPSLGNTLRNSHSTENEEECSQVIGAKARSTTEEFRRQAKEKTEKMRETAKEAMVRDTADPDGEEFKERVEKKLGNYDDKMGRE